MKDIKQIKKVLYQKIWAKIEHFDECTPEGQLHLIHMLKEISNIKD